MTSAQVPLLDSFSALADPTRCRMLWLLERHELTVSELCAVLQLPQSTVSRHLKTLADAGWVTSRRDGTSRYYALAARRRRRAARADLGADARAARRPRRASSRTSAASRACWRSRSETSQQFFATSAGQWDRLREELFGRDFVAARAARPAAVDLDRRRSRLRHRRDCCRRWRRTSRA